MARKVALLLEDEALIAIDVGETLGRAGYEVHTFGSCADAASWLADNPLPSVAVIDIELRDGQCGMVAAHLKTHGVPFVVHSGGLTKEPIDEPFAGGVLLPKPSATDELLAALWQAGAR